MDRLSIFGNNITTVNVTESSTSNLQTELEEITRELKLTRKGHEEWTWGEEVLDADLEVVELEDVDL